MNDRPPQIAVCADPEHAQWTDHVSETQWAAYWESLTEAQQAWLEATAAKEDRTKFSIANGMNQRSAWDTQ